MSDISTNYTYDVARIDAAEMPGAQMVEAIGRRGYGAIRAASLLTESTGTAAEIGTTLGTTVNGRRLCHVLETDGALAEIRRWDDGDTYVTVAAETADRAEEVLADLTGRMELRVTDEESGRLACTWWYQTAMGPGTLHGTIDRLPWASIDRNYPTAVRSSLAALAAMTAPPEDSGKIVLVHGPPGTGKAQPLTAKVLTPTGWTTMGEIQIGDEVCTSSGGTANVIGKYPQGAVPINRVRFSDGSSTRCCNDHLWSVQTRDDRKKNRPFRVMTTDDLRDTLYTGDGSRNRWIPICEPIEFADNEALPLHPYLVGVLLGDGYSRPSQASDLTFTKPDVWIAERINELCGDGSVRLVNQSNESHCPTWRTDRRTYQAWNELGLGGLGSTEKFIPDSYLMAPEKDRWELLAGLLDTDGHADNATLEYTTSSPRLAEGFRFLAWSLGCTFGESQRVPTFTYKGERRSGQLSYRFHLCPPRDVNPFRLPRKRDAFTPRTKYAPRRAIVSIEPDGIEEAACISIDSAESLYITDDFIVTHNSRYLSSLGHAWSSWADLHVITDAQRFFAQPDYIYDVAARLMRAERWAVLVAEDCDSLVDGHARHNPGLSALLNLADGLMGQGMPFVFVLSTNLRVDRFDPAIVRPGRCLANIAVPSFTADEAGEWLAAHGIDGATPEKGATLADLYAIANTPPIAASGLTRGVTMPPTLRPRARISRVVEPDPVMVSGRSIVASGRVVALHPYPVEPPRDWFSRREFDRPTPIVVTAEGQIYGHAVDWQTPHTASTSYGRKALRAPHCVERNQRFMNRNTLCDDGSLVATGPIYMDCSHTIMSLPGAMVQDAMAHSGMAIADVAVFDDEHGLQVAGAVRPTATRLQVRVLRGNSDLSPHWAPAAHFGHRGGGHVLLGLVAVNESGLPVRGIAASGYPSHPWIQWDATSDEPQTMVAVGVVHRRPTMLAAVQAQLAAHDAILGDVVADRAMREATARAEAVAARRR